MGLFKKLKKVFKKVTGFVKKTIKKTVKAVKKIGKKIKSSKILKALAIAAAIVVTGGSALTAFGGTGTLATSKLGTFMMNTSANMLGGTVFGSSTLGKIGNFAIKTVSKPFGAVGSTLGSTARVGTNILTGKPAFQAGQGVISETGNPLVSQGAGNVPTGGQAAAAPFSGTAFAGNQPTSTNTGGGGGGSMAANAKQFAGNLAGDVVTGLAVGYAQQEILGGDATGGYGSNLRVEGASPQDPLQIYAAGKGIDVGSIYNNMSYGTADPSFAAGADLYTQQTMAVG